MASDLKNIPYTNLDGMLNGGVSDFVMLDNECSAMKNCFVYKIGKLEKVPGYSKSASNQVVASVSVNFLHDYYDTANKNRYLLATAVSSGNTTIRYIAPNLGTPVLTWTTLTGISTTWNGTSGYQPDMENYLGKVFAVGYQTAGTGFLTNATITAVTFDATDTDITDMPQARYIVRYRDLVYVLHAKTGGTTYPSRAYYCDEPSASAIGWTGIATNFIEFGYDDGDVITGAVEALDRLVVFKSNSMWKYDESSRTEIAKVGCDSHRSIQKVNKVPYWYNKDGFWRWRGDQPELISAKAQPFIDAMNQANTLNVVATPYNGFEYRAFMGTLTVEGITYTNAWFCWDTRREKCYIRCTITPGKSACMFTVDGKRRTYFGDDTGYVYNFATKVDAVYADAGSEIDSFFITKNLDYGIPESKKIVNQMTVFSKYATGVKLAVDVDSKDEYNEANTQILKRNIDTLNLVANGNRYKYKFYEKGSSKSWQIEGFVISAKSVDTWQ